MVEPYCRMMRWEMPLVVTGCTRDANWLLPTLFQQMLEMHDQVLLSQVPLLWVLNRSDLTDVRGEFLLGAWNVLCLVELLDLIELDVKLVDDLLLSGLWA